VHTSYGASHYAVFFCHFLLGPNILVSTLFSSTFNQCSSISVRDQVSCPYKAISRIMVLYILIFKFLGRGWEEKKNRDSSVGIALGYGLDNWF
jgi:hypothetical protein